MPDERSIHAQDVQGGIVNVGGDQSFQGPVTVTIRDMAQTIGSSPNADEAAKAELNRLVEQLREALQHVPADQEAEAKTVARRTEELISEATQERPDKESVEFKGNKLKQAAEAIRDTLRIVMTITT
jgi:ElaB/YqjD/DUF883 family membrane-anchored ribosome-binding protein